MTQKTMIESSDGRLVPCLYSESKSDKAVIVLHGSSSSKESSTGELLEKTLGDDVAVFRIDLPGHGESPDKLSLCVRNALADIAAAEEFAKGLGYGKIGYFSSSLGAYLAIVYAYINQKEGASLFLRSAAVCMGALMQSELTDENKAELDNKGYYLLDEGFAPPLAITQSFLLELDEFNALALAKKGYLRISMVHASDDEVAPIADAREFAARSGAEFTVIQGGGHRLCGDGREDMVMSRAKRFFDKMDR